MPEQEAMMPGIKQFNDVLVIGGGLPGVACALQLAELGRQVLLVERRPALGWESTWAGQLDFGGPDSQAKSRLNQLLSQVESSRGSIVDAPILEMALDRLVAGAGVDLLLYAYPVRLLTDGDRALGVVIGSKSGEQVLRAGVVVDATEEALLWRQAGTPAGRTPRIPGRQSLFLNHTDLHLDAPLEISETIRLYPSVWRGEVRVEYDLPDASPLTARRQMPEILQCVRSEIPGAGEALLTHTANEPFPMQPVLEPGPDRIAHTRVRNLFGAGNWSRTQDGSPASRLALGEQVARLVADSPTEAVEAAQGLQGTVVDRPEATSDVLVVGGGTGGAVAAIAAGREGVQTTLLEASPALGGIGTGGAIHWYYYGLDGGIQDELEERIQALTPLFVGKWPVHGFHPEVKKCVLQQMAEEAEVSIQLNTVATGVLLADGKVQTNPDPGTSIALQGEVEVRNRVIGVLAAGPDGLMVQGARVFIDSTGDGDIAAMAGAPFIIGREKDNLPHAYSQPAGRLNPENGMLRHLNFDAGYVDPMNVVDLTRARRFGIQLFWQERFSDDNHQLYIAPLIGLRQSRQIVGEYQMTLADLVSGRRFEDAVSFVHTHYDNHAKDYENESDEAAFWVWVLGNWKQRLGCEVPYRSMLPRGVDGVLLACRALSMSFDAHAGFRMQRDIQRIGEVAGVASAQVIRENRTLRELDLPTLQARLRASGVLADRYRPQPAIPVHRPLQIIDGAEVSPEDAMQVAWLATQRGAEGNAALMQLLRSGQEDTQFQAASALAFRGAEAGVDHLLGILDARDSTVVGEQRRVPRWQAAIPFLGRAGDQRAVAPLVELLQESPLALDAAIATVRALGRLGDVSAIPPILTLLKRDDLDTGRVMAGNNPGIGVRQAVEDARWQLDLASAEALSRLGHDLQAVAAIVEPYRHDPRAYARRYAAKIQHEHGRPRERSEDARM